MERVLSYKYLGIWIDESLSFKMHIDDCFLVRVERYLLILLFFQYCDYGFLLHACCLCNIKKARLFSTQSYHLSLVIIFVHITVTYIRQ